MGLSGNVLLYFNNTKEVKQLQHTEVITSACLEEDSIVIGDVSGKITTYKDALTGESKTTMKEHWHAHEVKALYSSGKMLYSGGEEGVVVLWHRGVDRKNFLPRFGSEIL